MNEATTLPTAEQVCAWLNGTADRLVERPLITDLAVVANELKRIPAIITAIITAQAADIERLTKERDAALGRVEDLERDAENVSEEFEKECWKSLKSLLNLCGFDWGRDGENGVTADDAYRTIAQTITDFDGASKPLQARAEAAEAALRKLRGMNPIAIASLHHFRRELDVEGRDVAVSAVALDEVLTAIDAALTTQGGGE